MNIIEQEERCSMRDNETIADAMREHAGASRHGRCPGCGRWALRGRVRHSLRMPLG